MEKLQRSKVFPKKGLTHSKKLGWSMLFHNVGIAKVDKSCLQPLCSSKIQVRQRKKSNLSCKAIFADAAPTIESKKPSLPHLNTNPIAYEKFYPSV